MSIQALRPWSHRSYDVLVLRAEEAGRGRGIEELSRGARGSRARACGRGGCAAPRHARDDARHCRMEARLVCAAG